jgi:N-acetylmuramoyl-L-alanine amidase
VEAPQPLKGATVLLDAGHGAEDLGAAGIAGLLGGPSEKDLNLALALAIRTRLQQLGAEVVMVREDDSFLSLEERSRLAHAVHPDVYLAVHHNSMGLTADVSTVSGASGYYFTLPGKQLADCILPRAAAAGRRENDGSNWSYFYVTRMTYTPAVLLEYGFLVNPAEYEACADPVTVRREGDATAHGILEFFRTRLR